MQDDPQRTALSRTFQSQELSWGSAWATWFPHFLESQTLNLSLLLKVKFSKWDVSAVSESSLGICSLNKRERVWTAGDLFSRLSWVTEVLRTSFILAAWVAKLRGHFNIGLAGLHLWVSLCKYLSCGRSSVCFFAELLEISERFVRLKDTTKPLLALRQTNLVLGKIQWVFYGRKIVFVVEKSGLFAVQKTWGNKKLVTGWWVSFCCPWGGISQFQLSSFEPLSVFVPHYLAASLASREPDAATAKSQEVLWLFETLWKWFS